MFSLLELFFSCYIVVAVAKKNLLKMPAIISSANFQLIQMLRHPRLAFDWLSVSFFEFWPIRMSGLLVLCTELTLFYIELAVDVELSIWQDERISVSDTTPTFYFKLPYTGPFFVVDIKLVFSSFKIVNKLVWKTLSLVGPVRVWFTGFYVGETPQHLPTRVHEHLVSNGTSHIFRHLQNSQLCRTLCSDECFSILDHASTTF